jgi:uridine phosphorylase
MKLPILEFYNEEGVINKESYIASDQEAFTRIDLIKNNNIDTALMFFIKDEKIPDEIRKDLQEFYKYKFGSNENMVYIYKNQFVFAIAPLGEPASAGLMEELGFMGVTKFFACGTSGLINDKIDNSNLLLVERAIRDEGLSFKYEKAGVYTDTNKELTNALEEYLKNNNFKYSKITTWTTDCPYRETPSAIKKRLKQGASTVEMECAGWCSVAKYRNYQFAQILFTSDVVKQKDWSGFNDKEKRHQVRLKILDMFIDFLLNFVNNK